MKSIFIVEDEIIVAKDLEGYLLQAGYEVCGIATTYRKALEKLAQCQPDLILCDICLGSAEDGLDLMREVLRRQPVPFIVISAYSDQETLRRATGLRLENFLVKPISEVQLRASIQMVLERQVEQGRPTARELVILRGIAQGRTSKDLAQDLGISENTVESHRKNLMRKYGVSNSPELIRLASYQNWLCHG